MFLFNLRRKREPKDSQTKQKASVSLQFDKSCTRPEIPSETDVKPQRNFTYQDDFNNDINNYAGRQNRHFEVYVNTMTISIEHEYEKLNSLTA